MGVFNSKEELCKNIMMVYHDRKLVISLLEAQLRSHQSTMSTLASFKGQVDMMMTLLKDLMN